MTKKTWTGVAIAIAVLAAAGMFFAGKWFTKSSFSALDFLKDIPSESSAVIYADAEQLKTSPFLAALYNWAPHPASDVEYKKFVQDTGFDYERDLDRAAIAVLKIGEQTKLLAFAHGRFDKNKLTAYALRSGTVEKKNGKELLRFSANQLDRPVALLFLNDSTVAISDDASVFEKIGRSESASDRKDWATRIERVGGSPLFVLMRQDAAMSAMLSSQAPGGFRSPQMATLLAQLQWISIAGKPDGEQLRLVADGECTTETVARQLADMLSGLVILAESGLADPKLRQQMPAVTRDAYLDVLKSADISRLDRGGKPSVRVVLSISPEILKTLAETKPIPQPQTEPTQTNNKKGGPGSSLPPAKKP